MNQHLTIEEVHAIADGESQPDAHVRDCVRCSNAILDAVQMKRLVRNAMREDPAPASLRRRIGGGQPPRLSGQRRAAVLHLAAAAAVAAIVIGATMLLQRSQSPSAIAELADMHTTILASANPVDVLSTDKHTVKPWFEGRVPFAVPVPDLASTPFHLIGGRVVYWHGNQVAYLLVGKGAHRISVFVSPQHLGGAPPPAVSTLDWQAGALDFVAVGDVPEQDLAQLRDAFNR
jgi:anti-sigma factor RsiW